MKKDNNIELEKAAVKKKKQKNKTTTTTTTKGFYVFNWQVMVALEVSAHLAAATAEINHWLPKMLSFSLDVNESKMKIIN